MLMLLTSLYLREQINFWANEKGLGCLSGKHERVLFPFSLCIYLTYVAYVYTCKMSNVTNQTESDRGKSVPLSKYLFRAIMTIWNPAQYAIIDVKSV